MKLHNMIDVEQKVNRTVIDAHQRVANIWIEKTVHTVDGSTISVEVTIRVHSMLMCSKADHLYKVIYDLAFTQNGKQVSQYIEFVDTLETSCEHYRLPQRNNSIKSS